MHHRSRNTVVPLVAAWFGFTVVAVILYAFFGHCLVRAAYEGRASGIINAFIKWQHTQPLRYYYDLADSLFKTFLVIFPLFLLIAGLLLSPGAIPFIAGRRRLESHTDSVDAFPESRLPMLIVAAAALGLFMELMVIHIHSSFFQVFNYFKNFSLLSCFLGLGIGYLRGGCRPLTTPLVLPFFSLQVVFMAILRYSPFAKLLQNPIPEQLSFGLDQMSTGIHVALAYGFLLLIFAFNALCFIPLGQLASRLMARRGNLAAYSWNLVGSLAGILVFSLLSMLWLPPSLWIILAAAALMLFLYKDPVSLWPSLLAVIVALVVLALPFKTGEFDIYSPYQVLTLSVSNNGPVQIKANNTFHQGMYDLREEKIRGDGYLQSVAQRYLLPYHFKKNPGRVLILGSGTGNDIAAALRSGAGEIDAVEIDPAILELGRQLHPESPYAAPNVNVILDDARSFIRHTDRRYDLIVYGLLDSTTLLSGMSGGIRLDTYVYTMEALREAKGRLKEDGVLSLSFSLINKQLGRKLFRMLTETFGREPRVYGSIFLTGGGMADAGAYQNGRLTDTSVEYADPAIRADLSTDDWPFFYMPVKTYPFSYVVIIGMLLAVSGLFIRRFSPGTTAGFSFPCFFLGAGFMLIETKGITELALIYGSTWVVISVAIAAVLAMAFLANYLVMRFRKSPISAAAYGLLAVSLIAGLWLTRLDFSGVSPWLHRALVTLVLMAPLFFSGFAFSSELNRKISIPAAMSSNLLGAMLGGFLEYNSMYFGFRSLYVLALAMYACAFLASRRSSGAIIK